MEKLKIIAIFMLGILSFIGITHSNVPEDGNNIFAGIVCLLLALLLFFSLRKAEKAPDKTEKQLPQRVPQLSTNTEKEVFAKQKENYSDSKIEHISNIRTLSLFLRWCKNHTRILPLEQYPAYMSYSWEIKNPVQFHKQLIQEGYLVEMGLEQKIKHLKVVDLKSILREQKLPVSGKKQELIDRILERADLAAIKLLEQNQKEYCLSPKAFDFLSKCDDVISLESGRSDIDCYERDSVEKYQILSALDSKTCDICGELDGKIFPVKNAVIGVNFPPFHSGCRCTTVPYYDDSPENNLTRIARDPNTGKNIYVPGSMTYKEYKEKYL